MRIAVFGAAGRTGREVVEAALAAGHQVIAVVRDPDAAGPWPADVRVVAADVHDQASVTVAVRGADAVVSTLGGRPRQPTTVHSHGATTIGTAMREAGIDRFVCLSAGALDLGPHVPLGQRLVSRAVVRVFFRDSYADMARMEAQLRTSDLRWTAVRVPGLTSKPATGNYRAAPAPLPRPSTIPRADLAAYLLSILDDVATVGQVVEISV